MEGEIKVTPEQLETASSEFSTADSQVSAITSEMMNMVRSLTSAWEGEASQAFINKFNTLDEDMQQIHKKIQEHSTDLNEMAQRYKNTENDIDNTNSSIPTNLID